MKMNKNNAGPVSYTHLDVYKRQALQRGTFTGGVTIAAAVPEPETYAMLLAGLGLIGYTARRRKTQL